MEIITITVIGVLVFFVGVLCGCLSTHHETDFSMDSFYRQKASLAESELSYEKVLRQSREDELFFVKSSCRMNHYAQRYYCEPKVYCATVEEQELADIITKGKKTATQLLKDLDIPNLNH